MRISDWSSDVCSSDLVDEYLAKVPVGILAGPQVKPVAANRRLLRVAPTAGRQAEPVAKRHRLITGRRRRRNRIRRQGKIQRLAQFRAIPLDGDRDRKSTRLNSSH